MKLDKILAMSAYAVQALATLGLVFAVSHLLTGGEYGHYSLVVASAQSLAVLGFEWIRLAASRFCANVGQANANARKDTIQAAFVGTAAVVTLLAVGAAALGVISWQESILGWAIVLLIGITDLLLVFLRVQGSFNQFAALQMVRAFTLLGCSIVGAYWGRSALQALAGLCSGYLLTLLVYVMAAPSWWRWRAANVRQAVLKDMAVYGVSVAAASNIHLQVPLLIRWIGKAFLPAEGFAGLSLAMDVLQKPFALVASAVGGVLTPGVIVEFEKAEDPRSPKLKQLYEVQLWCVFLMLGLALAFLPELCELAVRPALREWVMRFGAPVALIFSAHTLIQTTISIPGHLLHMGRRLIAHAVFEVVCVAACMGAALYVASLRPYLWLWLGVLATAVSILYALPLVMRVPCRRPIEALYLGGGTAAALGLLYFGQTHSSVLLMMLKAVAAMALCVIGLWSYKPFYAQK